MNEVMTVSVPAYLVVKEDAVTGINIPQSNIYNSISTDNKMFTVKKGKELITKEPVEYIDVVLLYVSPDDPNRFAKIYFEGSFVPGEIRPPRCSSVDGILPNVNDPIHPTCRGCPKNAFGTSLTGKGKACGDKKYIYVAATNMFDSESIFRLSVPATSFANLSQYGVFFKTVKSTHWAAVTRINIDRKARFSKLIFTFVRFLTEEEYKKAQELREFAKNEIEQKLEVASVPKESKKQKEPSIKTASESNVSIPESIEIINKDKKSGLEEALKRWGDEDE